MVNNGSAMSNFGNPEAQRGSRRDFSFHDSPLKPNPSPDLKERVLEVTDHFGKEHGLGIALWGSLSRGELTPSSDIDLLAASASKVPPVKADEMNATIARVAGTARRVDTVSVGAEHLYRDFALRMGTDAHSVFFSHLLTGDPVGVQRLLNARNELHADLTFRVREFFNCFVSSIGLEQVLHDSDPLISKLSKNGTNRWVRLAMATQIRWPNMIDMSTGETLTYLARIGNSDQGKALSAWERALERRRRAENGRSILDISNKDLKVYRELASTLFEESIDWIQDSASVDPQNLKALVERVCSSSMTASISEQLDRTTNVFLLSAISRDPIELQEIARAHGSNWWIATSLVSNQATSSKILHSLAFPEFKIDNRYWQTIRLYVSKSKFTDAATLEQLLSTPGLRKQDYDSAQSNLSSRKRAD